MRMRPVGLNSAFNAAAARASPPPRAVASGTSASSRQGQHVDGLLRVQSEKTLTKSPRSGRKDSRSPSAEGGRAGTGRVSSSPLARGAGSRSTPMDRRMPCQRTLSPSQSEGSLPIAQRMVSAPADSHRSVTVRTKADAIKPRVGSGYGVSGRASAPGIARRISPEKSRARQSEGYPDTTPRSAAAETLAKESAPRIIGEGTVADVCVSGEDDEEDDGFGRRRLTAKQYEALVRCAQQVVTVSAMPPAPLPVATAPAPVVAAATLRSSPMRAIDPRQRVVVAADAAAGRHA